MAVYRKSLRTPALTKSPTTLTSFHGHVIYFLLTSLNFPHFLSPMLQSSFSESFKSLSVKFSFISEPMLGGFLQVSFWNPTLSLTPQFWFVLLLSCVFYFTFMSLHISYTVLSLLGYLLGLRLHKLEREIHIVQALSIADLG